MGESSIRAEPSILGNPASSSRAYRLSDDLARLCLPAEYKESYRKLAYVNSICLLFLIIGLIGIKSPRVITRPLSEVQEPIAVEFTPPEQQPQPEQPKQDEEPPPQDTPVDTPQVAPVVAVVESPAVAFSVPVQGAVTIAKEVRYAVPPPPITQTPRGPTKFDPNAAGDSGSYPPPAYPSIAKRNRYEGTVEISFTVDEQGMISAADIKKSSGYPVLDQAALDVVKSRWRFPPGKAMNWIWPCTFLLK